MKKILSLCVAILMFVAILAMPQEASASPALEKSVKSHLGTTNSSVTLRSAKTGKILYAHNGTVARQTASNMKLLTGAAALDILGEEYRFHTNLYIDGKIVGEQLNGNVYLKGSGDPTLQYDNLQTIARELRKQGIKKVNGHLYLDDTLFTGSTLPPGATKSEQTYYYAARTSALNMSPNDDFDAGTVIVQVSGGAVGKVANVKVLPHTSGQKIINNTRTGSKGSRTSISVLRKYNTNQIIVSGTIAQGATTKKWVTVQDPTIATGHAFKGALKSAGVTFANTSKLTRKAVPQNAKAVYTHSSRTLEAMFNTYMKLSNNGMADIFIRSLAANQRGSGSLATGLSEMRKSLDTIGVSTTGATLLDGSGLSSKNRVQSNAISKLLFEIQDEPTFDTFYKSLPVGGNSNRLIGGTLKNRFKGDYAGKVHAKTGYIDGVYSLSGYVETNSGNTLIFSILTEYRSSSAISGIDRVVKTIIDNY